MKGKGYYSLPFFYLLEKCETYGLGLEIFMGIVLSLFKTIEIICPIKTIMLDAFCSSACVDKQKSLQPTIK